MINRGLDWVFSSIRLVAGRRGPGQQVQHVQVTGVQVFGRRSPPVTIRQEKQKHGEISARRGGTGRSGSSHSCPSHSSGIHMLPSDLGSPSTVE